jgi:hypothetical protein
MQELTQTLLETHNVLGVNSVNFHLNLECRYVKVVLLVSTAIFLLVPSRVQTVPQAHFLEQLRLYARHVLKARTRKFQAPPSAPSVLQESICLSKAKREDA